MLGTAKIQILYYVECWGDATDINVSRPLCVSVAPTAAPSPAVMTKTVVMMIMR